MGLAVLRSSMVTVTHSVFTDSAYHALLVHGDTTEVVKMNDASISNKSVSKILSQYSVFRMSQWRTTISPVVGTRATGSPTASGRMESSTST